MIRRALVFVLVVFGGVAAAATPGCIFVFADIPGSGHLTTTDRPVTGFTKVRLDGSLDADVREGQGYACRVVVDENLQGYVLTEVHGDTLVVRTDQGDIRPSRGARVEIVVPQLRGVTSDGSGDATIHVGTSEAPLSLASSGSGDLDFTGNVGDLSVTLSGSGDATLRGVAGHLVVSTSGSGDLDAEALVARGADVSTSGSGDVTVHLEGGRSSFHTSGSGDVTWSGATRIEDVSTSGSGSITHDS